MQRPVAPGGLLRKRCATAGLARPCVCQARQGRTRGLRPTPLATPRRGSAGVYPQRVCHGRSCPAVRLSGPLRLGNRPWAPVFRGISACRAIDTAAGACIIPPFVAANRSAGGIAQLGERLHGMQEVRGSNPRASTSVSESGTGAYGPVPLFLRCPAHGLIRRAYGYGCGCCRHQSQHRSQAAGCLLRVTRRHRDRWSAGRPMNPASPFSRRTGASTPRRCPSARGPRGSRTASRVPAC